MKRIFLVLFFSFNLYAVPYASWRFDECAWNETANEVLDSSGNNYHGTSRSSSPTTDAQICHAGDFTSSGTSDYVILDHNSLDGLDDFSMSVWFKTSNNGIQTVVSGANSAEANEALLWFIDGSTFRPYAKGNYTDIIITNIADNNWHHFVWTRSGLENCAYIDGILQDCQNINSSTGVIHIDSGGLILAQEQDSLGGSFDSTQDFEGLIDELKIYNEKLDLADIQTIYNNENSQKNYDGSTRTCIVCPDSVPKADWRFDECIWDGSANEVIDSSGNSFNGISNDVSTSNTAQIQRAGDFTKDGTSDYVSLNHSALDSLNSFSVSTWLKTSNSANQIVLSGANASQENEVLLWFTNSSTFSPHVKGYNENLAITDIGDNAWHHFVWTRSSTNNCAYVDGISQGCVSLSGSAGVISIDSGGLIVGQEQDSVGGNFDPNQDFEGFIDELKIYPAAISGTQVQDIYNAELLENNYDGSVRVTIECSTYLLAEYRFDECSWDGNTSEVIDSSGNAYHGVSFDADTNAESQLCRAGDFNASGISDYVVLDNNALNGAEDFSISVWFKTINSGVQTIVSGARSTEANEALLWFTDNTTFTPWVKGYSGHITVNNIADGIWHHFVWTRSGVESCGYLDSVLQGCTNLTSSSGALHIDSGGLIIAQEQDSLGGDFDITQGFVGFIDELKIYDGIVGLAEIQTIYNNENSGKNYDGSTSNCNSCNVYVPKDGNYTAIDWLSSGCSALTHWDNTLSTRIVNNDLNFSILAKASDTGLPFEANITKVTVVGYHTGNNNACTGTSFGEVQLCSNCGLTDGNGCLNLQIDKSLNQVASECVEVKIEGKDVNDTVGTSLSESNSTDNFSLRPNDFSCDSIPASPLTSERIYTSSLIAQAYNTTTATQGYTTSNISISTNKYMRNSDLNTSMNGSAILAGLSFTNGTATDINLSFSDIGDIGIDLNDSTWANVDSDDTPEVDRVIHTECRRLFIPDHFLVEVSRPTLENNASTGFTYLSNLSPSNLMSAWVKGLTVSITAKGENNGTLLNYSSPTTRLYANEVTLTPLVSLPTKHSSAVKLPDVQDENSSDINMIFTNGVATHIYADVGFNYSRNFNSPINPFQVDGNESSFQVSAQDLLYSSVIGSDSSEADNNASFYYGRLKPSDLISTLLPSDTSISYEVHDNAQTKYTTNMKQSSLTWYINNLHTTQNEGNITQAVASSNTLINNALAGYSFTYNPISLGNQNLGINTASNTKSTVHLKTQEWLWYVPSGFGSAYADAFGTDCTMHPCFKFSLISNNTSLKVQSGDFNGTVIPDVNRSSYIQKGVKLFR